MSANLDHVYKSIATWSLIYAKISIVLFASFFLTLRFGFDPFSFSFEPSGFNKTDPPFNLTLMKGSRYVILERDFANFVLKVINNSFLSVVNHIKFSLLALVAVMF